MSCKDIITIESSKRSGKPCIRGMRITVDDVLSYLASGMNYEEILEDFPYLTKDDILACLSYAADRERQPCSSIKILEESEYVSDEEYLRSIEGMVESIKEGRKESVEKGVSSNELDW